MQRLGVYVHIPFCVARCNYCGFYSTAGVSAGMQRDYVDSLIDDIIGYGLRYRDGYIVDSVFIGGGTPSVLDPLLIRRIMANLYSNFHFSADAEITIESNPGSLDERKLNVYRELGINRLSMGVQSFDDGILKVLGRIHSANTAVKNFTLARECGFDNINIDLMFAVPGHSMDMWTDTLDRAIDLNPEHISFYSLQLEEGTPFFEMFKRGEIDQISDELDRDMYHMATGKLKDAGYIHYEISNCAKAGYECRHNLKYWSMEDYLGIGDSASSYMEGIRFTEGKNPEFHENTLADNASEFVFTGLRKTEGIKFNDFRKRYKKEFWEYFYDRKDELDKFFDNAALIDDGKGLRLSEKGIDISNKIMSIFV